MVAPVAVARPTNLMLKEVTKIERFAKLPKQKQAPVPCQPAGFEEKMEFSGGLWAFSTNLPNWTVSGKATLHSIKAIVIAVLQQLHCFGTGYYVNAADSIYGVTRSLNSVGAPLVLLAESE
jgi:hypothetical protein